MTINLNKIEIFRNIEPDIYKVAECDIIKRQVRFLPDNVKYRKIIKKDSFFPLKADPGSQFLNIFLLPLDFEKIAIRHRIQAEVDTV